MVSVLIETQAGKVAALGRLLERYGCQVFERGPDHLRVGFPDAATEGEAIAEARLYVSMRPAFGASLRLGAAGDSLR
jgi:hypothetical protein